MLRRKEKPRVVLLDCNLEYKKGESQMSLEIMKEEDFSKVLEQVSHRFDPFLFLFFLTNGFVYHLA